MADPATWTRAQLALHLLAVDPSGLGGLHLRGRVGPVRDTFVALLPCLPLPLKPLHPTLSDEALFGGLDLSATLAAGQIVQSRGLLADPGALVLAMAERTTPQLAARLAAALDGSVGHCLIGLDEGTEDEALPTALAERCAFFIDLDGVALGDLEASRAPDLKAARAHLRTIPITADHLTQLAILSLQLGIDSLRAPLFALRAARALAALERADAISPDHLAAAAALTLAHRATQLPTGEQDQTEPPDPPEDQSDPGESKNEDELTLPEDLLLEAVRALLPTDLLATLAARKARTGKGSGSGAATKGNRRGRPLPARAGRLGNGARIDIVATLRAAAPWQTIRATPDRPGLQIRPADIRLKRFEDRSDRLLIFAVDASGSSALARLAEAKGAVELLLAQAYARRDHVALVAFRGKGAELLLPPTRSLVQTKRRLAALPGGGGTPLAAGLKAALEQADHARRRGLTPTIALLTDGRANVALDGTGDRAQAALDATAMAQALRAAGADALVIDTGNRPEPWLASLAATLGGTYLPLPRADAKRLSAAVAAALN